MLARIRRGLRKPPRVILVRGAQEAALLWREKTGGWGRTARCIEAFWTPQKARALRDRTPWALFHPDGPDALRAAAGNGALDGRACIDRAADIGARRFRIFGVPVPETGPMPWLSDWRFDHSWPLGPERHADHYAPRARPHDIKFPWELSRLHFLPPLLLGAVLEPRSDLVAAADSYLADWQRANPLGMTVNWAPMESSMRVISLVLALDLLRAAGAEDAVEARVLAALHQSLAFVWAAIEDTDVRGNHFTANLAALMLGGLAIRSVWPPARRYVAYAEARFAKEIDLQFTPDGMNFEKSFFYHRLVSELFLLMALARRRHGYPEHPAALARLRAAARVTAWLTGPDGRVPVWGDSDDAEIFTLDGLDIADHRSLLSLAGSVLDGAAPRALPSGPLLTGRAPAPPSTAPQGAEHFSEGGFFVLRAPDVQFLTDLGEVGMNGRGGHGHNDILSFALWVQGRPVIVDPGSYVYSGDLAARERFRSSAAHNGLTLDGEEIARLGPRPFRIHDDARPLPVDLRTPAPGQWHITGGHDGYMRLPDPARHWRRFELSTGTGQQTGAGQLKIVDRLEMAGSHRARRHLQFAPGIRPGDLSETELRIDLGTARITVRWDPGTTPGLETGAVSTAYAQSEDAARLTLDNDLGGTGELALSLEWAPAP